MGLGQKLQFATRRNKTNQIRIRKRELDASNNRSFASEIVSSDYEVTALVGTQIYTAVVFYIIIGSLKCGCLVNSAFTKEQQPERAFP